MSRQLQGSPSLLSSRYREHQDKVIPVLNYVIKQHAMRANKWGYSSTILDLSASGQLDAPAALPLGRGGWLGHSQSGCYGQKFLGPTRNWTEPQLSSPQSSHYPVPTNHLFPRLNMPGPIPPLPNTDRKKVKLFPQQAVRCWQSAHRWRQGCQTLKYANTETCYVLSHTWTWDIWVQSQGELILSFILGFCILLRVILNYKWYLLFRNNWQSILLSNFTSHRFNLD
jgi:hypothetical protein